MIYVFLESVRATHLAQGRYPVVDEGFLRFLSFQRPKLLNLNEILIWLHFIMTSNLGWNANWLFVHFINFWHLIFYLTLYFIFTRSLGIYVTQGASSWPFYIGPMITNSPVWTLARGYDYYYLIGCPCLPFFK